MNLCVTCKLAHGKDTVANLVIEGVRVCGPCYRMISASAVAGVVRTVSEMVLRVTGG